MSPGRGQRSGRPCSPHCPPKPLPHLLFSPVCIGRISSVVSSSLLIRFSVVLICLLFPTEFLILMASCCMSESVIWFFKNYLFPPMSFFFFSFLAWGSSGTPVPLIFPLWWLQKCQRAWPRVNQECATCLLLCSFPPPILSHSVTITSSHSAILCHTQPPSHIVIHSPPLIHT